jgi:hypothetical protein
VSRLQESTCGRRVMLRHERLSAILDTLASRGALSV